jgi:hydroxyethylthiazole kinase-like uncharacterized protein yjeF
MQKLLTSAQTHLADAYTIQQKQISSIELMEAASVAFVKAFTEEIPDLDSSIGVLCGKGNNGGDGLAIARLLKDRGYRHVSVYLIEFSARETPEYKANKNLLIRLGFQFSVIDKPSDVSLLSEQIIIDAILGSGLNKPLQGYYLDFVKLLNALNKAVIAVDVPTGFPAEGELQEGGIYLKADLVICFQRPKINFFFPESAAALSRFRVVDIGLDEEYIQQSDTPYQLMDHMALKHWLKPRKSFSHKGTYGHALIIAGQEDTMGAALLSSRACLHAGAGLTSVSIPQSGLTALNTALPEVMYLSRSSLMDKKPDAYKSVAIGPGLGKNDAQVKLLKGLLEENKALVIDADALNILAANQDLLNMITPGSVLTPHMKEFDNLFGQHNTWWARLEKAQSEARRLQCVIVLKNQYTFIIAQDGMVTINCTGNAAMAQGGMGDVLTGIIASFMAQGHPANEAACLACYVHGKAGDELALSQHSVSASQVADQVAKTLKGLIK